jgi:molecular chaperone GrpE
MMDEKDRDGQTAATGEPEDSMAGEQSAGQKIDVETLVPGLEEEIARQEGGDDGEAQAESDAEEREPTPEEIIAALEAERDDYRDKWTRALAEAENVRRRAERDKRDASTYGGTRLARDLLSVYDNLERAMKAADDELREQAAAFLEGVELTRRELVNAFAKHQIEPVRPEPGEKFDPNRHQAMFEAPIPGAEPGTVIECLQDGFVIADRLLRPAMVGVARAADPAPAADNGDGE